MEEAGRTLLKIVPVEAEVAVVCSWAEKLCWEIANRISNSDFLESVETGDYIAGILTFQRNRLRISLIFAPGDA
jgi:hypothetical protein